MSDPRDVGRPIGETPRVEDPSASSTEPITYKRDRIANDPIVRAAATAGEILWTLTRQAATAQARRWTSSTGVELEFLVWTGTRIEGQEDLCWSQLFPHEEALMEAALAKKRQLESSGWLEDIDLDRR
jgi:hypothetical protein